MAKLYRFAFLVAGGKKMEAVVDFLAELGVQDMEGPVPAKEVQDPADIFGSLLKGKKRVSRKLIAEALEEAGRSKDAVNYYVGKLQDDGVLRPTRERGVYEVVTKGRK